MQRVLHIQDRGLQPWIRRRTSKQKLSNRGGNQGKTNRCLRETRNFPASLKSPRTLFGLVLKGGIAKMIIPRRGTEPSIPRAFGATLGGLRGLTAQHLRGRGTSMLLNEDVAPYNDSWLNQVHESVIRRRNTQKIS
jgi:hypothetical protein